MSLDLTEDKPTLVQVMAWCLQATSLYLSHCWPRSVSSYGVSRPQMSTCFATNSRNTNGMKVVPTLTVNLILLGIHFRHFINVTNPCIAFYPRQYKNWVPTQYPRRLASIENLIVEIVRSQDRLILTIRFNMLVMWHPTIESPPCYFTNGIIYLISWYH